VKSGSYQIGGFLEYTSAMSLGEFLPENFAGDLEYHPRRAVLYLGLGVAAACFWVFSSPETRFTAIPLVFALGSLTLVVKGVFLFRKSSESFGLSEQEVSELSKTDPIGRTLRHSPIRSRRSCKISARKACLFGPCFGTARVWTIPGTMHPALKCLFRVRFLLF
jgi:hypothetical protein